MEFREFLSPWENKNPWTPVLNSIFDQRLPILLKNYQKAHDDQKSFTFKAGLGQDKSYKRGWSALGKLVLYHVVHVSHMSHVTFDKIGNFIVSIRSSIFDRIQLYYNKI